LGTTRAGIDELAAGVDEMMNATRTTVLLRPGSAGVRNPPFLNASLLLRFFVVKPDSCKLFSPQTSLPRQNRVMAGRKKRKTFLHELISVRGRAVLPHGQNPAGGCRLTGAVINGSSRR
jgi:hypothetical protein